MNITEASKILGLSERTLRRAIKNGSLQAREFKGKHGKEYEINPASLEAYIAKKTEQTVIHTEATERRTGQSLSTLDNTGTLDTNLSMENVSAFLDRLNSFINHLRTLDKGQDRANNGLRTLGALPDILTIPEAAIYLGVGPQKVREFIQSGKLKATRLGRGLKISKINLEKFKRAIMME